MKTSIPRKSAYLVVRSFKIIYCDKSPLKTFQSVKNLKILKIIRKILSFAYYLNHKIELAEHFAPACTRTKRTRAYGKTKSVCGLINV